MASDLDGTLLNDQGVISQKNIDAVQEFVDGGGLFTIATGRTVSSAQQYVEKLAVNAPVIVTNGSLMYDYRTNTIPWDAPLPEEARGLVQAVLRAGAVRPAGKRHHPRASQIREHRRGFLYHGGAS